MALKNFATIADKNKLMKNFIGMGYSGTHTPGAWDGPFLAVFGGRLSVSLPQGSGEVLTKTGRLCGCY